MSIHLSPSLLSTNTLSQQPAASMTAQPNPQPGANDTPTSSPAQPRQVEAPAPGDPALVEAYSGAIQRRVEGHQPGLVNVPTQTVLGQWLELHRSQLEHPIIQGWMREQNIDPSTLSVIPSTGAMSAKVNGVMKDFTLTDGSGWAQVCGPLVASAQVIAPGPGQALRIRSGENTVEVSAKVVANFYGIPLPTNLAEGRTQLRQLERNQSFGTIAADDRLRPAHLRSAEALEAQKANTEAFNSVAPQKLAYSNLANGVANDFPSVHNEAKQWAKELIEKATGQTNVDPDSLYLNRFRHGQSASPGTATGAMHMNEEPFYSKRLPDALLDNFSEHDWNPGQIDAEAGIYTAGPGESAKGGYGAHNQFPLAPSTLMHESWKTDFQGRMTSKINNFWNTHGDAYRTTLKGQFVQQARQQLSAYEAKAPAEKKLMPAEHQFTRDDYRLVMKAASNLPQAENAPLTVDQLKAEAPAKDQLRAYPFDINGWGSSDIIRFAVLDDGQDNYQNNRRDGLQILYIPGATPAFLRFASLDKMDEWVVEQAKDPKKREALASHFSKLDRQDGGPLGKSGVDTSLAHLANGDWSKMEGETIDRNPVHIEGDVFSQMRDQAKARMTSDADISIKSNSEVTRDTWLNDVSTALKIFAPMAPGGAAAAATIGALGVTELALGAEKAASGDTPAERSDGAWKTFDGALNTLFSVGAGGKVEDPFAAPGENVTRLPGQGGTPNSLGRDLPDRLQPSQAGNISGHAVADGDQLIANSPPNSKGIYQVKDGNGVDQWLIRHTDDTGISKVYEIKSDFKLSDNYVQIIDPLTRKPVMTVNLTDSGEWIRASGQGGWPWSRNSSSSSSIDQPSPSPSSSSSSSFDHTPPASPIAKKFEVPGLETSGAETIDQYLIFDNNVKYDTSFQNTRQVDGVVTEKRFQVTWSLEEDNFSVLNSEKARPTPLGESDYSDSFVKDIHRLEYSVTNKQSPELNRVLSGDAATEEGLKAQMLRQFEEIVPDPMMRARISEVAHQGSMAPTTLYMNNPESGLQKGYFLSGGTTQFTIDYDPGNATAKVTVISKNPISNPDKDIAAVPGAEITTQRTFTIRETNEIGEDNNPYIIDKHAPTTLRFSVLADLQNPQEPIAG
ncbi:dermonecrotic toxin domain-containing protein [Pseudomonas sp. K5002]|uniref:dermonecrotic toxin domain-containing protein n=1 Tax=Pseudomonas sp. K5002 TaxID=2738828 RepID=UPI0015B833B2|nr:DUF6543 domain-containing protein [Pseudomonas sp. K5002]NWD88138.1 hypothetical protein [Pseudomonas sp. K5002]